MKGNAALLLLVSNGLKRNLVPIMASHRVNMLIYGPEIAMKSYMFRQVRYIKISMKS